MNFIFNLLKLIVNFFCSQVLSKYFIAKFSLHWHFHLQIHLNFIIIHDLPHFSYFDQIHSHYHHFTFLINLLNSWINSILFLLRFQIKYRLNFNLF